MKTIVNSIQSHAASQPDKIALKFLEQDYKTYHQITYRELSEQITQISDALVYEQMLRRNKVETQKTILLLFDSGIEYITSFLGVLKSGNIAVTAYPPRHIRHLERLLKIVENSKTEYVLTTRPIKRFCDDNAFQFPQGTQVICVDELEKIEQFDNNSVVLKSDYIAMLQYTSGSTGTPKGVIVTHENIISNLELMADFLGPETMSTCVSWLPIFHDMGLFGNTLLPLYSGNTCVFMAPYTFLKAPLFWMQSFSAHEGTYGMAPNFTYDLCTNALKEKNNDELDFDLSKILCLVNGAEPIRPQTVRDFEHHFQPFGLVKNVIKPGYGMAETTLCISVEMTPNRFYEIDKEGFEKGVVFDKNSKGDSVELVSCGKVADSYQLKIVDPDTLILKQSGEVGEIWVSGRSVTSGYYENHDETNTIFCAYLSDTNEGPFLRTGDLGFVTSDGRLVICGRAKDLLIINGRNIYPQDIEMACYQSHSDLLDNSTAAFSIPSKNSEECVIVAEAQENLDSKDYQLILKGIGESVYQSQEVIPKDIILIPPRNLLKTSSGKIQRQACKNRYLKSEFKVIASLKQSQQIHSEAQSDKAQPNSEIIRLLKRWIASQKQISMQDIDVHQAFSEFGFDSIQLVNMLHELEQKTNRSLEPWILWEYPTIDALNHYFQAEHSNEDAMIDSSNEPIAVIGMDCLLPGKNNKNIKGIDRFWENLKQDEDNISPIPQEHWDNRLYFDADRDKKGRMYCSEGGYLSDIKHFDAKFFNISPIEASYLDPQQRLLLMVTWHALEDAGIQASKLKESKTGIYIGLTTHDYDLLIQKNVPLEELNTYQATGTSFSIAAGRLAYFLGTQGPCMAIDTACSSSLVSIHQASQSLQRGECHLAIAGGVNMILSPEGNIIFCKSNMLSPKSRCQTFDASADGYVRGEGCGIVILKRLTDAIQDNDKIYAVIHGSAVNQDGASNGLTAPNLKSQMRVINSALSNANLQADQIEHVEAHGTGTPLGDPIEWEGIRRTYGLERTKPLNITSLKTRMGHLEAAAGVAGFIKTALSIHHGKIPAHLNFSQFNPQIKQQENMVVPRELIDWNSDEKYAGVSSFGFSGTNAHIILGGGPKRKQRHKKIERSYHLWTISAQNKQALRNYIKNYKALAQQEEVQFDFASQCHHLLTKRAHLKQRAVIVAKDIHDWLQQVDDRAWHEACIADSNDMAWLFTGQGGLQPDVASKIYKTNAQIAAIIDHCCTLSNKWLPFDLKAVLLKTPKDVDINHTTYTQPALFVFEFALATWLLKLGLKPKVLMGHSLGEYVAACLAEVITLEDAIMLVCKRALLFSSLKSTGAMLAISASTSEVQSIIQPIDNLVIALKNGPSQIVVSGPYDAIEACHQSCENNQITSKKLAISHPFHSPLIEPIADEFEKLAQEISYQKARIPIISNLTGQLIKDEEFGAAYLRKHMLETVEFHQGMLSLLEQGVDICLEIGPKPLLTMQMQDEFKVLMQSTISAPENPWPGLLETIGKLHARGIEINWHEYDKNNQFIETPLLKYPFQNKPYWLPAFEKKFQPMSIEASWKSKLFQDKWVDLDWKPELVDKNLSETIAVLSHTKNNAVNHLIFRINQQYPDTQIIHITAELPKKNITEALSQANRVIHHISSAENTLQDEVSFLMKWHQEGIGKMVTKPLILITEQDSITGKSLFAWIGSIREEHPEWSVKCLDVLKNSDGQWLDFIFDEQEEFWFLRYLGSCHYQEKMLDVIDIDDDSLGSEISSEDVCLVTGAYGDIGQALIETLFDLGVKSIVAVGRQANKPNWSVEIQQKIKKGLQIHYFSCDVAQEQSVKNLLTKQVSHLKPITMVIHTAGVNADKTWLDSNKADIEKIIGSKADGAWYLHQHTKKLKLKSFICISSMSAIFGNQGQAIYATANAFLIQLVNLRLRESRPAQVLVLGPVKNTGLFKQNEASLTAYLASRGIAPITKDELKYIFQQQVKSPKLIITDILKPINEFQMIKKGIEQTERVTDDDGGTINTDVILKIAQKVLGAGSGDLSIQDNWFELGMDSIMAAQLAVKINQQLNQKLITAKDIFSYSSVALLVEKILKAKEVESQQQNQTQIEQELQSQTTTSPLSLQQQEIWRFIQKAERFEAYHIPLAIQVEGKLSKKAFQQAISNVVVRHDILRCSFHVILGQVIQHICDDCTLELEMDDNFTEKDIEPFFKQPFDLSQAPLIKSRLIQIEQDKHVWLLNFHHLIADGMTVKSFIHEVFANYEGKTIAQHAPQYFNYVRWQWDNVYHALTHQLKSYWYEALKEIPLTIPLLKDTNQPVMAEVYSKNLAINKLSNSLSHLEKNKLSVSNFLLASLFESLMTNFNLSKLGIVVFFSGRDGNYTEVFGDISNDVVITSEKNSNIFVHTRALQNQIWSINEKQHFRLDVLKELGLEKPAISFDYQRGIELNLETDFNLTMINTGNVQNHLWGDEPRLLSFKVLLTENQLKFAVKYRKDKIDMDTAQTLLNGWLNDLQNIESKVKFSARSSQSLLKNCQLSPLQSNLWQLLKNHPNGLPYYIPLFKEVSKDIDIARLNMALNQAIKNTPALRVSFKKEQQNPVWSLQPNATTKIQTISSSNLLKTIQNLLTASIEPNKPPLIKAYIIKSNFEKNTPPIFLLRLHHLICDGLGAEYFLNLLESLYLKADEYEKGVHEDGQYLAYFKKEKSDYVNQLKKYSKYVANINQKLTKNGWLPSVTQEVIYAGSVVYQPISAAMSEKIKRFCQKNHFSQYAFYLYFFALAIAELTNDKIPYISLVKANRMSLEDSRMMGYFADNIPALIELDTSESIVTQIKKIQLHMIDLVETYQQPFFGEDLKEINYQQPSYLFNHYSLQQGSKIFHSADYVISDILKLSDDTVMLWNYLNPEKLNFMVRSSADGDMLGLVFEPSQITKADVRHFIDFLLSSIKQMFS